MQILNEKKQSRSYIVIKQQDELWDVQDLTGQVRQVRVAPDNAGWKNGEIVALTDVEWLR